jgi:8-oxo-dGTP pyrophosphatase MutT (NUDIX family)
MSQAAGILFTDGKKMLLLKRSNNCDEPNTWGLPFGGGRKGESPIETAIRETKEEIGIKTIPGKQITSVQRKIGGKRYTVFVYRVDKPFGVRLSKEHSGSKWASLGSIRGMNLHPQFRDSLDLYLRAIRKGASNFAEWVILHELVESTI